MKWIARWIMFHIVWPLGDMWYDYMMEKARRENWERRNARYVHDERRS